MTLWTSWIGNTTVYANDRRFPMKAFITITQINEVKGRGFTMEKLRYDELNHTKN